MLEEIAARYAAYSAAELFELARAGEGQLRPEAWQTLKDELRKRGLELTPEDETLASGPADASPSLTTDAEVSESEPAVPAGIDEWLGLFLVLITLNVSFLTYRTLAAVLALSWMGVLYALPDAVLLIGIVLTYHRDPLAPRFWRAVLILNAGAAVFVGAGHLKAWSVAAPAAAISISWAAYWNYSRRVRATFVSRPPNEELNESPAQDDSEAEPVPDLDALNAELNDARRQGNFAVAYIAIGLGVTVGTYSIASFRGGGTYTIAWGALLFGTYGAARSSWRRKCVRALLQDASAVVMPDSPGEAQ